MIDIHAHILPGLDDGANDLQDTLEMAQMAVDSGVRGIVATPHCNQPGIYDNYYGNEYIETFRRVSKALKEYDIPLQLYPAMEVFVTSELPKLLADGKILTINGGHYILVEFDFGEDPDYVNRMLDEIYRLGLKPVIAHPERYEFVQENPQIVYSWRQRGYQVQVNKGSFTGRFGRRAYHTAYRLLSHNLVTAVASDCHSPHQRTPYMRDAYQELAKEYSRDYLNVLFRENPVRICQDEPVFSFKMRHFEEDLW